MHDWQRHIREINVARKNNIIKSFTNEIEKGAALPIGSISMHGGKKMKKTGKGKWEPVAEGKNDSKEPNEKSEKAQEIINGKGSKSQKARDLHDLGMKTSSIAKNLEMHYSHAHTVVKKHKDSGKVPVAEKVEEVVAFKGDVNIVSSNNEHFQQIQKMMVAFSALVPGKTNQKISSRNLANSLFGGLEGSVKIYDQSDDLGPALVVELTSSTIGMTRIFYEDDDGQLICENESMNVSLQGQGLGTSALKNQIKGLKQLGIQRMKTMAAGYSGGFHNGYYTWGRLGYIPTHFKNVQTNTLDAIEDAMDLSSASQEDYQHIENSSSLIELLSTEKGKSLFKEYGSGWSGSFDLTDGSDSMIIFEEYLKSKGQTL